MADTAAHYTAGGLLLAAGGWIIRLLQVRVKDAPMSQTDQIREALQMTKAGLQRIELLLTEVDLPAMKRNQAIQAAELDKANAALVRDRSDISDLRREAEERDERIDRIVRQQASCRAHCKSG